MGEPVPPPWGGDSLSKFFSEAQHNERASSINMAGVYALLQRTHAAFERVLDITEKENTVTLLPTRFLMARARGAWLAAVRLGMSGQTVEAYPLVRAVIENAWYALHLAKDPAPPARAEIWLRRRESVIAKARCKTEFSVAKVRKTHAVLDAGNESALHGVYERTIEMGAHPNELGVLGSTERTETDDAYLFDVAFLTSNPLLIALVLKTAIEAAVGALRTFRLIFPERFTFADLDDDIQKLAAGHNAVFTPYSNRARTGKRDG
jgi:hypothetical protein